MSWGPSLGAAHGEELLYLFQVTAASPAAQYWVCDEVINHMFVFILFLFFIEKVTTY